MIKGSCCCGAIRFELSAPPKVMVQCHCSRCRKVGSSAFVIVARESVRWIAGRESVATFKASKPYSYSRTFCRECGTALGELGGDQDTFPIAANCLDDDPQVRTAFHEFVEEKPDWYEIHDDARQFPRHPKLEELSR